MFALFINRTRFEPGDRLAFVVGFAFVFVVISMVIGYVIGPRESANRCARVVPTVAVAQRNTSACILTFIFALGTYAVPGVTILGSSLMTIIVLLLVMSGWSKRYTERQETTPKPEQSSANG